LNVKLATKLKKRLENFGYLAIQASDNDKGFTQAHTFKTVCKSAQRKNNGEHRVRRVDTGDYIGNDSA